MEDSQIRDRLAVERTRLANERTLLAYARTAVMLAASGFTVLKFAGESGAEQWLGGGLLIGAALVAAVGCRRFQHVHGRIDPLATNR
jgi:putative membrane protein